MILPSRVMAFMVVTVFIFPSFSLAETLNLRTAIDNTLRNNPQLTGYQYRVKALQGEQESAALKPEYRLSADMDNVVGTGDFSGVDASELTLSLSSVIEMGDQRDARLSVVTASQQQLASEQRVLTLNVLTELTRQFIAVVAAQEQLKLQQDAQALAEVTVKTLLAQVQAGRTPEAELIRAKATLARANIDSQKAEQQWHNERFKLGTFWAESDSVSSKVQADLFALPESVFWQTLIDTLNNNPDLTLLNDVIQLRSAELRKAQTEGKANLEWNAGFRQMQETDDSALVFGLSMPLGSAQRAKGAIASASANQQGAEHQLTITRQQLRAELRRLYDSYQQAIGEIKGLQNDVLPLQKQALAETTEAFSQGRYSYLEISFAQAELLDTQQALIDAAVRAQQTRIDIEHLTGAALTDTNSASTPLKEIP